MFVKENWHSKLSIKIVKLVNYGLLVRVARFYILLTRRNL